MITTKRTVSLLLIVCFILQMIVLPIAANEPEADPAGLSNFAEITAAEARAVALELMPGNNAPVDEWDGTVASSFARGTGTKADPYIIETAEQLAYFAKSVNSGNTYENQYVSLTRNIKLNDETFTYDPTTARVKVTDGKNTAYKGTTLDGTNGTYSGSPTSWYSSATSSTTTSYGGKINTWTPIGNNTTKFKGYFDGLGCTISNMYICNTNTSGEYGLFGYAKSIKNLIIKGAFIYTRTDCGAFVGHPSVDGIKTYQRCANIDSIIVGHATSKRIYVGGIASGGSNFTECINTGLVILARETEDSSRAIAAGIAAMGELFEECINTGEVKTWNTSIRQSFLGGITGADSKETKVTVKNCYNSASVGFSPSNNTGDGNNIICGGIQAVLNSSSSLITNCYNTGEVVGTAYAGGIIAWNVSGTVSNCYSIGGIKTVGTGTSSYAGGIAGRSNGESFQEPNGEISNCFAAGDIFANSEANNVNNYPGAVIGENAGAFSNIYYDANQSVRVKKDSEGCEDKVNYVVEDADPGKGTATDLSNLKSQSFMAGTLGFDFNNTWELNFMSGYSYPTLKCFGSQKSYSISYTANGGTGAPDSQTKTYGSSVKITSVKPNRVGYNFIGWSENPSAGSADRYSGDTYSANDNILLFAVWEPVKYTITFNATGGTGGPSSQIKTHGQSMTISNMKPTRSGYEFLGWSTSPTATSPAYYAGGTYAEEGDTTLYAVWKQLSISGKISIPDARYGDVVYVSVDSDILPREAIIEYRWYRDGALIPNISDDFYEIAEADVGANIYAEAVSTNGYYGTVKSNTIVPKRAFRDISIISVEKTGADSVAITAYEISHGEDDGTVYYGYSSNQSSSNVTNWQIGNEFVGIPADANLYFFVKITGGKKYEDAMSSATPYSLDKTPVTGSVEIVGEATIGSYLTALVTSDISSSHYRVEWYRTDISSKIAEGYEYRIDETDAGKSIYAVVVGMGNYTGSFRSETVKVSLKKQEAPNSPAIYSVTDTSVTLIAEPGLRYRISNGAWKSASDGFVTFNGLTYGRSYVFYASIPGNSTTEASPDSAPLTVIAGLTHTLDNAGTSHGLEYVLDSSSYTAILTDASQAYGEVAIPSFVLYGGKQYAVTSIAARAFENNAYLTGVLISDQVESIGDYAFSCCTALEEINVPNSVIKLGDGAFSECQSLTYATIGHGVNYIDAGMFLGANKLKGIDISIDNSSYHSSSGVVYTSDSSNELTIYPAAREGDTYTIENNTSSVASYAFANCLNLKHIVFIGRFSTLNSIAVYSCPNLETMSFSYAYTEISESAVAECDNLWLIYGKANSTASDFANANGYTFLLIQTLKNLLSGSRAFEYDTLEYMDDVQPLYEAQHLTMMKKGYYSVNITNCTLTDYLNLALVPTSTGSHISAVHSNGKDVIVHSYKISIGEYSDNTESFNICVYSDLPSVKEYKILCGDTVIASSLDGEFDIAAENITPETPVYAVVVDTDGVQYNPIRINIETCKLDFDELGITELLGYGDFEFQLPGFEGNIFRFSLFDYFNISGIKGDISISYNEYNDSFRIGFRANETMLDTIFGDVPGQEKNIEKFKAMDRVLNYMYSEIENGNRKCDNVFTVITDNTLAEVIEDSVKFDYLVAFEVKKENEKWQITDGYLVILAQGEFTLIEGQAVILYVPVVYKVTATVGAQAFVRVGNDDGFEFALSLTLPQIRAQGGVGVLYVADVSLYGQITNTLYMNLTRGIGEGCLNGEIGVSVSLFGGSRDYLIRKFSDYNYPLGNLSAPSSVMMQASTTLNGRLTSPDGYTFVRTSMESAPAVMAYTRDSGVVLYNNVYSDASPTIVQTDSDMSIAVWSADIVSRSTGNHIGAVYQVYDDNSWTDAELICDDGTADYYPTIASDGESVYAVWMNSKSDNLTEESSIDDIAAKCDIVLAKFNEESGRFEEPIAITDNDALDVMPQVFVEDGVAYIAWVENENSDIITLSGENKIMTAMYSDGTLSVSEYAILNSSVSFLSIGKLDNELAVAYIGFEDGENLASQNTAVEVYCGKWGGEATRITSNDNTELSLQFATVAGEHMLIWAENGALRAIESFSQTDAYTLCDSDTSIATLEEFTIIGNGEDTYIMTVSPSETDTDVYIRILEGKNGSEFVWSGPVQMTETDGYVDDVCAILKDDGTLSLMHTLTDVVIDSSSATEEVDIYKYTSLVYAEKPVSGDISIDFVYCDMDSVYEDGGVKMLPVELSIDNIGSADVSMIKVISDVGTQVYDVDLPIGGKDYINIDIPMSTTAGEHTVCIMPYSDEDKDLSNNEFTYVSGVTDLRLEATILRSVANKSIALDIYNIGDIPSGGILTVRKDSAEGELLSTFEIESVEANSCRSLYIDPQMLNSFAEECDTLYFVLVADDEINLSNNTVFVSVADRVDSTIKLTHVEVGNPRGCVNGNSPADASMMTAGLGYSVTEASWSPEVETFVDGEEYTLTLTVICDEGYAFDANPVVYIANNKATIIESGTDRMVLSYTYVATRGVAVSGTVKSYNPTNESVLNLIQNGEIMYTATIGQDNGYGLIEQSFVFENVASGEYDLVITKRGHLSYTIENIIVGGLAIDLSENNPITMVGGDVNNDGCVDLKDVTILTSSNTYGKSYDDAQVKDADVNGDLMFDLKDLVIITSSSNYGKGAVVVEYVS